MSRKYKWLSTMVVLSLMVAFAGLQPACAKVVLNEIMANAHDEDQEEYIELFNDGALDEDLTSWTFTDGDATDNIIAWNEATHGDIADSDVTTGTTYIHPGAYGVILDQEYVLGSGGTDTGRQPYNFPPGTVIFTTSNTTLGDELQTSDTIVLYDVGGFQEDSYTTALDPGNAKSRERRNPFRGDFTGNWGTSTTDSTAGYINTLYAGGPVVNEVLANAIGTTDDFNEYVEIYNNLDVAIDINGWKITDEDATDVIEAWNEVTHGNITDPDPTFDTTVIPAGGYAVILDNEYELGAQPYNFPAGAIILTVGNSTIGDELQTNDPIRLYTSATLFRSSYTQASDPGDGKPRDRIDYDLPDIASNWINGKGPTPGDVNSLFRGGPIKVYFNRPDEPNGSNLYNVFDSYVAEAKNTIDAALYDISSDTVVKTFQRAVERIGASNIRIVTDNENYEKASLRQYYDALEDSGIAIDSDQGPGLSYDMHNKFIIVDRERVWTGSWNTSYAQTFNDIQNVIVIESKSLADSFTKEFEEMFVSGLYHNNKTDNTEHTFTVAGRTVKAYFSPTDGLRNKLLTEIGNADTNAYFSIFSFSNTPSSEVQDSFIAARNRGVQVRGVFDRLDQSSPQSKPYWVMHDTELMYVRREVNNGRLHSKYAVFDAGSSEARVVTGSYNWSNNAENGNDENFVIVYDEDVADSYVEDFNIWYKGAAVDFIALTEIMANPLDEDTGEWIEIYSWDNDTIDLGGWYVTDDDATDVIEAWTAGGNTGVGPGNRYGVVFDPGYVSGYTIPDTTVRLKVGNSTIGDGLTASTDPVRILDNVGSIHTISTYTNVSDPGNGVSRERVDSDSDDVSSNWKNSTDPQGHTLGYGY